MLSAALVAVAAVLAIGGGHRGDAVDTSPHFVGVEALADSAELMGHPIYWAGPRPRRQLELTDEGDGSVYLRYLPLGLRAGDPRPRFLTVGTYAVADAVGALRHSADESGGRLERVADGGALLADRASPTRAYLAFPGTNLQIEVYDPASGRALALIRSGAVRPIGSK